MVSSQMLSANEYKVTWIEKENALCYTQLTPNNYTKKILVSPTRFRE